MRMSSDKKREPMAYLEDWEVGHTKKTQRRAYIEVKGFIHHFRMIH